MNILQNINAIAKKKGLTLTEIERACQFSKSSMRKWSENIPSIEKIDKVAHYLGVGIECIITGRYTKEVLSEEEQSLIEKYRNVSETARMMIQERAATLFDIEHSKNPLVVNTFEEDLLDEEEPFYLDLFDLPVSAGYGSYADFPARESKKVPRTHLTESADYMVRVSGDSMEPRFSDGDIVLVQSTPKVEIGETGIFILNDQAFIKERGERELISLNEKYPNIPICEGDRVDCQGKVLGILDIKKGA